MILSDDKRLHALKALSALSKFLGIHEYWRLLVKNHGLKWSSGRGDDLIIARLTRTVNDEEIIDWIRQVKAIVPDHAAFLDLMAATGLRFEEAINSWNLIIRLGENRLGEYYKSETLEHFRFKELFIRRTKKAFISFVPIGLIKRIVKAHPLTRSMIVKKIQRRGLRLRFGDIREYHASYLTKYLRPPEIDFLHGRISTSVFMRNYFNPAWIKDLKERTLRAAEEILKKIAV